MTDNEKVNMIAVLFDIQEQLLLELKPQLRHSMKQWCNKSLHSVKRFIAECDSILSDKSSFGFGNNSDEIREILEGYVKKLKNDL